MRKTHYLIVGILSLISVSTHAIDSQKIAAKHPIIADKPVPGFFEGALLGNGALVVVVTTRPDAICLHFGHNNVWDIRIAENNKEKIGTFDEIFTKAQTTLTDSRELPKALSTPFSLWHTIIGRCYLHLLMCQIFLSEGRAINSQFSISINKRLITTVSK